MTAKKTAQKKATKVTKPPVAGGEAAHIGKAERMRQFLETQPKVNIIIPLLPGEAEGSTESVILNGYD